MPDLPNVMETLSPGQPAPEAWAEQFAASLHVERARADKFLAVQQARLERARSVIERQLERLEKELDDRRRQAEQFRIERDALGAKLTQTESWPDQAPDDGEARAAAEELRRRYESAMDELRGARNKNAELQQQLAKARSTAAKLAQQARQPGRLDWEAEKRRIIAALEADLDGDDQSRQCDRLRIDEVLRTTDEIVAAKDREILELQRHWENRSLKKPAKAPDQKAIDQAPSDDAAVRRERERLKCLQDEWRDKLLEAEVEISLERAKIARQRAELDEKLHLADNSTAELASVADPADPAEGSVHRRWLARLGLTDADMEPGRHL